MFDVRLFEAKIQVFKFDHQFMNKFKFVQCSKNDVRVRSMFYKMVFDPSLNTKQYDFSFTRSTFFVFFQAILYCLISCTCTQANNYYLNLVTTGFVTKLQSIYQVCKTYFQVIVMSDPQPDIFEIVTNFGVPA